jgi:hypothetical protein
MLPRFVTREEYAREVKSGGAANRRRNIIRRTTEPKAEMIVQEEERDDSPPLVRMKKTWVERVKSDASLKWSKQSKKVIGLGYVD